MARSVKKGPYIRGSLLKKVANAAKSDKKGVIKTYSRESTIIPDMVGLTMSVYNGRKFIPVYITEQHVGHKLGEFSPTRVFYGHAGTDKKVKRK